MTAALNDMQTDLSSLSLFNFNTHLAEPIYNNFNSSDEHFQHTGRCNKWGIIHGHGGIEFLFKCSTRYISHQ